MFEMDEEETKAHINQKDTYKNTESDVIGPIFGIVGIMVLNNLEFLCVINEIAIVGCVNNMNV